MKAVQPQISTSEIVRVIKDAHGQWSQRLLRTMDERVPLSQCPDLLRFS